MDFVRAHTNIALIKYWGKTDAALRLPAMSSLSMTLDQFYTETKLTEDSENSFYLNGQKVSGHDAQRVFDYLALLQKRLNLPKTAFKVESINHVLTAAGLASSSSAFAALAGAVVNYYQLPVSKKELSILARLGSGSASRSIYGGFSIWQKGTSDQTSFAYSLDEDPKLDLKMLIVELATKRKKTSSTMGMEQAKTSPFYQPWLERNQAELEQMVAAIKQKDFRQIGQLAELNASEMHAINLSARPGFTYFEPATIKAIKFVQKLRQEGLECYYTIDAGPNIKLLCQLKNCKEISRRFEEEFSSVKIIQAGFGPGISLTGLK